MHPQRQSIPHGRRPKHVALRLDRLHIIPCNEDERISTHRHKTQIFNDSSLHGLTSFFLRIQPRQSVISQLQFLEIGNEM